MPPVDLQGLAATRRALARLGAKPAWDAALKDANFRFAEAIKAQAVSKAQSLDHQSARAAETLKASKTATRAVLRLGSRTQRYAVGAEFGAFHNLERRTSSGRVVRGWNGLPTRNAQGRFLWPSLTSQRANLPTLYAETVQTVFAEAFGTNP